MRPHVASQSSAIREALVAELASVLVHESQSKIREENRRSVCLRLFVALYKTRELLGILFC